MLSFSAQCSTQASALRVRHRYNQLLLDRAAGLAPVLEPAFPAFNVRQTVDCDPGETEVTMGGLSRLQLGAHFRRTRGREPTEAEVASLLVADEGAPPARAKLTALLGA